ncbi:MAG: hypothetical protein HY513_05510 [Candidatus Aenigmarchaeota archaeon]|nr:hypothetical protein [Candidatus Aenigmarchaeota archaeon]
MMQREFNELQEFLDKHSVKYEVFSHEPVITSEEATAIIGVPVEQGAKAIVVKDSGRFFFLAVLPGNRKINLESLGRQISDARLPLRLACHEEVLQRTGCEIGSVHPFGLLFELETFCDAALLKNKIIYFNPGVHEHTVKMNCDDYIRLAAPAVCEFTG